MAEEFASTPDCDGFDDGQRIGISTSKQSGYSRPTRRPRKTGNRNPLGCNEFIRTASAAHDAADRAFSDPATAKANEALHGRLKNWPDLSRQLSPGCRDFIARLMPH